MITLAGVPLPLPTPEIRARIEADISLERLNLLFGRAWPGYGQVGLAVPTHYRAWPPLPLKLNRFTWPTGASRYAFGLFLADSDAVTAIHDAAFGSSGTMQKDVELIISSEDDTDTLVERIKTDVSVLPPVPLYRVLDGNGDPDMGMYLIAVVDQRYYWWQYACDDFGITDVSSVTWADVFGSIAATLGTTITVGTVDSRYLKPNRALNLINEPVPLVLESACYNVGHRLLVSYAGKISTQPFGPALTAWKAEQASQVGLARTVRAGGRRFLDSY